MASKNEQKIQEIVDAMAVPGIISTSAGNKITGNQIASTIRNIPKKTSITTGHTTNSITFTAERGYYPAGVSTSLIKYFGVNVITPRVDSITLKTQNKYVAANITIRGDANLIPANIKNGVSIFGVSGTYTGSSTSIQYATGHISLAQNSYVCLTEIVAGTSNINVLELNGVNGAWNIPINTILTIVWNNTAPPYYNDGLRLIGSSGQSAPRAFVFSVQSDFTLTA